MSASQTPLTPPTKPASFSTVLENETSAIRKRRRKTNLPHDDTNLAGLALSGGGIRSATFSIGLLQALQKKGLLNKFDYLSTVSGGGFAGSWLIAWMQRSSAETVDFVPDEYIEPTRYQLKKLKLAEVQKAAQKEGRFKRSSLEVPPDSYIPDGSLNAGLDPLHHVRLFSNYLTPVKGAFSSDVWRAVAVFSRNLLLTWTALIPMLFVGVLAAQLYYTLIPHAGEQYLYPFTPSTADSADLSHRESKRDAAALAVRIYDKGKSQISDDQLAVIADLPRFEDSLWASRTGRLFDNRHKYFLRLRMAYAAGPIFMVGSWVVALIILWLQNLNLRRRKHWLIQTLWASVGSMAVALSWLLCFKAAGLSVTRSYTHLVLYHQTFAVAYAIVWLGGFIAVLFSALDLWSSRKQGTKIDAGNLERIRSRITRLQTRLMILAAVSAVFLLFGGFGHELVSVGIMETRPGGELAARIAKAGGVFAVLLSIIGSLFTGFKASPKGGSENVGTLSITTKVAFAITPPLIVLVLLCSLSWAGHFAVSTMSLHPLRQGALTFGALLLNVLSLAYALGDMSFKTEGTGAKRWLLGIHTLFCGLLLVIAILAAPQLIKNSPIVALILIACFAALLAYRFEAHRKLALANGSRVPFTLRSRLGVVAVFVSLLAGYIISRAIVPTMTLDLSIPIYGTCFTLAVLLLVAELIWGRGTSYHAIALASLLALCLAYVILCPIIFPDRPLDLFLGQSVAILISYAVGVVVLVGWAADPNAISLHSFYKSRLVRAYLGASNSKRLLNGITDTVEGDDLCLHDCDVTDKGGPYLIVNTTLNLVGAKDLASIQRKGASFVLTPQYCGSTTTEFRPTCDYMDGTLSLGTAAAVSGAAASPNMGSKSLSSSLAMLLSLLNVRLGYWAPHPSRPAWKVASPHLWPFFLLRESVSETTQLEDFVYLTDGGHFDNTGVYSLIERGCKFILLSDNGADPEYCFGDLASVVRRCRIDFGTEFHFEQDLGHYMPCGSQSTCMDRAQRGELGLIQGEYTLSDSHIETLWPGKLSQLKQDLKAYTEFRTGKIVIVKPHVRTDSSEDIKQYHIKHTEFPQQSTAEQWFSEDRFESYRKLGEEALERCTESQGECGKELAACFK